jgi:hypothetical protein
MYYCDECLNYTINNFNTDFKISDSPKRKLIVQLVCIFTASFGDKIEIITRMWKNYVGRDSVCMHASVCAVNNTHYCFHNLHILGDSNIYNLINQIACYLTFQFGLDDFQATSRDHLLLMQKIYIFCFLIIKYQYPLMQEWNKLVAARILLSRSNTTRYEVKHKTFSRTLMLSIVVSFN